MQPGRWNCGGGRLCLAAEALAWQELRQGRRLSVPVHLFDASPASMSLVMMDEGAPEAAREELRDRSEKGSRVVARIYLAAAVFITAGVTLAVSTFLGRFSRFHVVEDYLATDSGVGFALTRVFPQERWTLTFAILLAAIGAGLAALGLLRDVRRRRTRHGP